MKTASKISASIARLAVLAGVTAAMMMPVHADVLVSNTAQPLRGTTVISASPLDQFAAQSFSTDANAYQLNSIDLVLGNQTADSLPFATLHADVAGSVGGVLTSFGVSGIGSGTPSLVMLMAVGSPLTLAPSTTYWIVLGEAGTGSFGFSYAQGNSQVGPGSLGAYRYSVDAGLTWGSAGTDDPHLLGVNVTPVPEPSTYALMLMGLLGIGIGGRAYRQPRAPQADDFRRPRREWT